MLLLDIIVFAWIVTICIALFVWLPRYVFPNSEHYSCLGRASRMVLFTWLAVVTLGQLHILNTITLLLCYGTFPLFHWLRRNYRELDVAVERAGKHFVIKMAAALETYPRLLRMQSFSLRRLSGNPKTQNGIWPLGRWWQFFIIGLTVGFALLFRLARPLAELRLANPESYANLLRVHELMAGTRVSGDPFLAIATSISLISSANPMQVIRFLPVIVGISVVLAVGYGIWSSYRNSAAALASLYFLGACTFIPSKAMANAVADSMPELSRTMQTVLTHQWAGGSLEFGLLFAILAPVLILRDGANSRGSLRSVTCCLLIIVFSAPWLLLPALLWTIGSLVAPQLGSAAAGIVWTALAITAAVPNTQGAFAESFLLTAPVGVALLIGSTLGFLHRSLAPLLRQYADPLLAGLVLIPATMFLLPPAATGKPLEYDSAARQTLKIASHYPQLNWIMVAPGEQMAEIYGRGWHEDLAKFVLRGQTAGTDAAFDFGIPVNEVFVMVEMRPFRTFESEPEQVSAATLTDASYRQYRSLAGRASLEFVALQLCESYRNSHLQGEIFYEDEALRIYHFHLVPAVPEAAPLHIASAR